MKSILFTMLFLSLTALSSFARMDVERHYMNNAVNVFMTMRGQELLKNELKSLIEANGISINTGFFPNLTYQMEEPFTLDQLGPEYEKYRESLQKIREKIKEWLNGFTLNDPLIKVDAKNIQYHLKFDQLGIITDFEKKRQLMGNQNGAVLVLFLQVPEIKIQIEKINILDLANDILNKPYHLDKKTIETGIGFKNFEIISDKNTIPLKIMIPIVVQIKPGPQILLQALEPKTNAENISLLSDFKTPMIFPPVKMMIGDQIIIMDPSKLEETIKKKMPMVIKFLQKRIDTFVKQDLPKTINEALKTFATAIEEVNELPPPTTEPVAPGDNFIWGLQLDSLNLTREFLHLNLRAFLEDPRYTTPALDPKYEALYPPSFSTWPGPSNHPPLMKLNEYDLALTINQGFVNRILELSFLRKYFSNFATSGGSYTSKECKDNANSKIVLVQSPRVKIKETNYSQINYNSPVVRLSLRVQQRTKGFEDIVLKDFVEVEFDVLVKIRKSNQNPGNVDLLVDSIDAESLVFDKKYIHGVFREVLYNFVVKQVKSKLKLSEKCMKEANPVLAENVPLAPNLLGIPLEISYMFPDVSGHVVLLLKYGGQK